MIPQASNNSGIENLSLPRILCFHGGGTNAKIFRAQCRALVAQLKSTFRLVFVEAPFASHAGPDVLSVYSEWGPFKRWLRWKPDQPIVTAEHVVDELDRCIDEAKQRDDHLGATGPWVAVLGFSQGAKLCASLLYRQQVRMDVLGRHKAGTNYRFGIILAGRAPFISLDPNIALYPPLPDAAQITDVEVSEPRPTDIFHANHVLRIPTLHVHGMRDAGLHLHQQLFEDFCSPESKTLIEWDGEHRVPIKLRDVSLVTSGILALARETGVY